MSEAPDQRVEPYEHDRQEKTELGIDTTYEYRFPFNYENVEVDRSYYTGERHGLELQPISENMAGDSSDRMSASINSLSSSWRSSGASK